MQLSLYQGKLADRYASYHFLKISISYKGHSLVYVSTREKEDYFSLVTKVESRESLMNRCIKYQVLALFWAR